MFRNQSSHNLKIIIKMSITKLPSMSRFRAIKHALVVSFKIEFKMERLWH